MPTKGYLLIELLIVLLVISSSSSFYQNALKKPLLNIFNTINMKDQIELKRLENLLEHNAICLGAINPELKDVCYNQNGNINKARTISIESKKMIFNLGYGHNYILD